MKINQRCSSCTSIYGVTAQQYRTLKRAWCPACGHPNAKHPESMERSGRMATCVADGSQQVQKSVEIGRTRNRAGLTGEDSTGPMPLEILRQRIEEKGKCFIIGDNAPINVDTQMILEARIPCIGIGDAWRHFDRIDALILSDYEYTKENINELDKWQLEIRGRYIFWQREMESRIEGREPMSQEFEIFKWISQAKQHGIAIDSGGKKDCDLRLQFKKSNVQYFDTSSEFVRDLEIPLRLKSQNPLESAINLAYLLGAKEVILLGVDIIGDELLEELVESKEDNEKLIDVKTTQEALRRENFYIQFEKAVCTEFPIWIQRLAKKVEKTGKIFIIGTAPSIDELPLQRLFGFPTLGCNAAFQKFPFLDGLCFGDVYFVEHWGRQLIDWQGLREEKPILFWQDYGGQSKKLQRIFGYIKGQPSTTIHENLAGRIQPIFSLKHSIMTVAINCAYWLGAREIYLLGTEFGAGHFYDPDSQIYKDLGKVYTHFPHVDKIIPFIKQQHDYLENKGILLATCWGGECALKGVIPYVSLEEAADGRYLTQLYQGGK